MKRQSGRSFFADVRLGPFLHSRHSIATTDFVGMDFSYAAGGAIGDAVRNGLICRYQSQSAVNVSASY